ncbi:MAG: FG-GAP-like repeat-containing protein [Geminicoccaceae bacterium]
MIDLTDVAAGVGGFKIQGEGSSDSAGRSVAGAGDIDGDGFADLLIGSGRSACYVIYGKSASFGAIVDLHAVAAGVGGFKIIGEAGSDQAGRSPRSAGDVNGDGLADLLIDAQANRSGGQDAGAAYLVYGHTAPFPATLGLASVGSTTPGVKLQGLAGELAGYSVSSCGDINGDGYADLVVGAPNNSSKGTISGAAYVLFGKAAAFTSTLSLAQAASGLGGFKIQGQNAGDVAGTSVSSAGDINGDGFSDLLIGAYGNDAGGTDAGAAYVVFGKSTSFGAIVDLDAVAAGTGGFKIKGAAAVDEAGWPVSAAGDVNADGFADILVGARGHDGAALDDGAAYLVLGRPAGFPTSLDLATADGGAGVCRIQGEAALDEAGASVAAAGDVNGDGFADIVIGAPRNGSGAAYVIYGKASGFGSLIDLADIAAGVGGFKIQGTGSENAGSAVAGVGDINGDGYDDLLVGAPFNSSSGNTYSGAAYLVYGFADQPKPTPGPDVLQGTPLADNIDLLAGDDSYTGLGGNDRITGGKGADWLRGSADDDTFVLKVGGDGIAFSTTAFDNFDMVSTAGVADSQSVNGRGLMYDSIDGGSGVDTVLGSSGSDAIVARMPIFPVHTGQSALKHIANVERFDLAAGNDLLDLTNKSAQVYRTSVEAHGGDGRDTLWTGWGNDKLFGEAGNDILAGGRGNDVMTGGPGNDVFGFSESFGADTITDFIQGQDKLRVEGFGAGLDTFAELKGHAGAVQDTTNGVQLTFTDASTVTVLLQGFHGTLTAGDFIFVT